MKLIFLQQKGKIVHHAQIAKALKVIQASLSFGLDRAACATVLEIHS